MYRKWPSTTGEHCTCEKRAGKAMLIPAAHIRSDPAPAHSAKVFWPSFSIYSCPPRIQVTQLWSCYVNESFRTRRSPQTRCHSHPRHARQRL
eukprot:314723-Prorocentrum_minimum.AAC.6